MQQARVDVAFSKMNTCAGGCDYLDEECCMIAPANILLEACGVKDDQVPLKTQTRTSTLCLSCSQGKL